VGIYIGDLALYGLGYGFGGRVLGWHRVRRYLTRAREARFTDWFAHNAAAAILASRFLPGTRFPLYVSCGALGASFGRFSAWSFVAVSLWTPALVLASAGSTNVGPHPLVAAIVLLIAWRLGSLLQSKRGRQRLVASVSRLWRWEFWPMWLFYAPVALWMVWLTIRYRGFDVIAAANPGMPDGGIVGESKSEILTHLPPEFTIGAALISPGSREARMWCVVQGLTRNGWMFPLVFKPDVGQRGTGVKIIRTLGEAAEYLTREVNAVVVQPFHPGPFEAGVFYYRLPGARCGHVLSITDKHFPCVIGDGCSTIEDLIWADKRLRMQAATFLARHDAIRDRVLAAGERLQLAVAGNHAQGTLFRDGRHLITAELEHRIDSIARSYTGFFIGRFDIRYADVEHFKAGEDLAIVELNGATAESTNIYDPSGSLLSAYRQLFRQWSLVFAIGAINRAQGTAGASARRLFDLVRAHLATKNAFQTSD
jgi:hypothetical protein